MKERKRIYKFILVYLIFTIILTIISFIYALLLHKGILYTTNPWFNNVTFIIGIILFFILGLLSGIVAKKNGLIEGLLSALIIIGIVLLFNLIIKIEIKPMFFIKLGSYLLSSMAGGIIGVNIVNRK